MCRRMEMRNVRSIFVPASKLVGFLVVVVTVRHNLVRLGWGEENNLEKSVTVAYCVNRNMETVFEFNIFKRKHDSFFTIVLANDR